MISIAEVVLAAFAPAEHDLAARTDAGDRDLDVDLVTVERDLARDRRPRKVAAQIVLVGFEAEMALRDMIVLIGEVAGLSREDAYTLCSIAADLRVTQTVNGSKGIHCMLAKKLLAPKAA